MNPIQYKPFYQRNLPHFQPHGGIFFITFRVANSLPQTILQELNSRRARNNRLISTVQDPRHQASQSAELQKRLFAWFDKILAKIDTGLSLVLDYRITQIVADRIHALDQKYYDLIAFCIMPNHVHIVLKPLEDSSGIQFPLGTIMQLLKGFTSREINRKIGQSGSIWQDESYDHSARDVQELERIIEYVIQNPVAAGLAQDWREWKWTYCRDYQ